MLHMKLKLRKVHILSKAIRESWTSIPGCLSDSKFSMLNNHIVLTEFFAAGDWFIFCFVLDVLFFSLKTKNDAKTKNKFKSYSLLYYRLWAALEKMWRASICLLAISVHRQKEDRSFWGKIDKCFKENIKNLKNRYTSPCGENLF